MPKTILVVAEQRPVDGAPRLNRSSLETLNAAQQIAREVGGAVEVVLAGFATSGVAQELAGFAVERVISLESEVLAQYTAETYVHALVWLISELKPDLVLLPHTYQVRDFAPLLALRLERTLLSDCTGFRVEGEKLLFTRQLFQGKFAAEISFNGPGPWIVSLQNGAFRADQAVVGSARVEVVAAAVAQGSRVQPEEIFREAKQAVIVTERSDRGCRSRHQGAKTLAWSRNWLPHLAERLLLLAQFAMQDGCRLTGKSAPAGRRLHRSCTLLWESPGLFSILLG